MTGRIGLTWLSLPGLERPVRLSNSRLTFESLIRVLIRVSYLHGDELASETPTMRESFVRRNHHFVCELEPQDE